MAMMRFAVLSLLICFLAGVTYGKEASREKQESEEKKPSGSTGFDYGDYKPPGGWPEISGHPIPPSLAAGISWGPFIPLGMPFPQPLPSFPGSPIDGMPLPAPLPSFPSSSEDAERKVPEITIPSYWDLEETGGFGSNWKHPDELQKPKETRTSAQP